MSPSFAYGRGGRRYRYYITVDLQTGRAAPSDGEIRRISAGPVEAFALELLQRLSGRLDVGFADVGAWIQRLELRKAESHLVVAAAPLFAGEHPQLGFQALQSRLSSGEQAVLETADGAAIRVVIPRRLQLRGGRTWIEGEADLRKAKVNPGLVRALRSTHTELVALDASPLTSIADFQRASAPQNVHRRKLSRLAFLAPDLQQAILGGSQPRSLTLRKLLKSELPLAWADQRELFARL